MEKQIYESPELELITFAATDVIRTSDPGENNEGEPGADFS